MIEARVKSATIARVRYYDFAGGDSTLHRIPGSLVRRIEYEDGRVWTRNPARTRQIQKERQHPEENKLPVRLAYKPRGFPNVLTINTPGLMFLPWSRGNHNAEELPDISGGIGYERFLDKRGRLSASLAGYAYMPFISYKSNNSATFWGYHVQPALLYHPRGNSLLVDYSAGLGVAAGMLYRSASTTDSLHHTITSESDDGFVALLGQLNLTLHHVKAFVFGIHLSGGPVIGADRFMLQAGLKFGGRF